MSCIPARENKSDPPHAELQRIRLRCRPQQSAAIQHRFHPATDASPVAARSRREHRSRTPTQFCHWV